MKNAIALRHSRCNEREIYDCAMIQDRFVTKVIASLRCPILQFYYQWFL